MPKASPYEPQPPDTASIPLPNGLDELVECLATQLHDVWARQRLDQGWIYGPERSDQAKTHPDLVPYEELTEQEKEFDRQAATQTIKTLISLGYQIVPINNVK
ncbi:MAG: RyR domain-containing protein [Desulfobulbus sp.]|nr:RyR domain-containing protein [Desulfobulbus sp.]